MEPTGNLIKGFGHFGQRNGNPCKITYSGLGADVYLVAGNETWSRRSLRPPPPTHADKVALLSLAAQSLGSSTKRKSHPRLNGISGSGIHA